VEEYRALLSQQAEPLESKAVDGLALAVNAARDHGVTNDCARQATALLVKHRPEEYGPSPEVVPAIPAPAIPEAPHGYGLLAEVEGVPVRPAPRRAAPEPSLPPLRVRPASGQGDAGARDAVDPQERLLDDDPIPARRRGAKKRPTADDDEDLLP
jgi:hypothetical protein